MELQNKTALVTGAGSGIGKASALRLAAAGARVIVHAHRDDETRATVDEIVHQGGDAFGFTADIRDDSGFGQELDHALSQSGRLDIVVANAGINGVWAPIDELKPAEWDNTINTNLRGAYLTLHLTVPHLKRAGGGSIVIISSINGTRIFSHGGASAYSTTKAGLLALGKMTALELAKHKIRVNVVCPGKIDTDIDENTQVRSADEASEQAQYPAGKIPLTDGKAGSGDDIADMVVYLSSERARFITGTPVWIDGGQSLLVG
ncbi:SDR family oxidoreductase [Paraburkholderia rhizosphaerae]|uniref:NAD(P)-dependent dehydrogenase (Short-subunit alcohol dehydrogenase family) n=1 Tax=Paraburkholderia rhizosphaerae TaxID=480658 RepID=A0A4R8L8F7_9BURK|nr:SDR family NAD(P)-dependent oxidoreductase [Paraburkholderia rhizosphaerae]TDY39052.1 NAD(P)-dependent dehydrogenase (short-subunit alcohol dehydrogenase family) [Paraburkholderia rhizosphaerae]